MPPLPDKNHASRKLLQEKRSSLLPPKPIEISNESTLSQESTLSTSSTLIETKPSWLQQLFFFKQPKICSLLVYDTQIDRVLRTLYQQMNQITDTRFYEKYDKIGNVRRKAEIKAKKGNQQKKKKKKKRGKLMKHYRKNETSEM
ncbi:hypothetical protein G6F56_010776 [Rhizopus delemar]|nr:hypothetical protein G6F56_010776 [Rhizopus delemar]